MKKKHFVFGILGLGLLIRILSAYFYYGFPSDIVCFAEWADRICEVGPMGFYSSDYFTDYPPGYIYILYVIGAVKKLFNISGYSQIHILLIKMPAILCDLACCCLIYKEAKERVGESQAVFLVAAYAFNPAVILNSSLWGQVDSVYTLFVVLMCLFVMKKKLFRSYIAYGLGVLIKPQMLIFTPVLLVGILDYVSVPKLDIKKLMNSILGGLAVLGGMVLLCLPFGIGNVVAQLLSTLNSYPYAAVNAYNFWGLLGLNYVSQDMKFLFLSYSTWGTIVILLIVIFAFMIHFRLKKDPAKYPLIAAFIVLTMFTFSVRMHERYMYPAMALLLLYYIYKPLTSTKICYGGFTLLHTINVAHVLFCYDVENYDRTAPIIILTSLGMLVCMGYFYFCIVRGTVPAEKGLKSVPGFLKREPAASEAPVRFHKADMVLLLAIMTLYSVFALYDLGNKYAPSTTHDMQTGDSIVLEFEENSTPVHVYYYIAPENNRIFSVNTKGTSDVQWNLQEDITFESVFTWKKISLSSPSNQLQLTLLSEQASILELVFTDAEDNVITPINAFSYPVLFDEGEMFSASSTFRDSMYFDEIYHARTAYEYIYGLDSYEGTHPPLGKIFISLGVLIFGMNPFGWRIMGTLFGIAMLPFIYLLSKQITGHTPTAALACFLFAFDFMHFVQTRIATIDVYITFFVILMYYFMYRYCRMSFYDTSLKKTFVPLGLCGICMGFGIACKWTGVYAGVGLAILFFMNLFNRYREYKYAKENPEASTNGIAHKSIVETFLPNTKYTIGFCMIFFVAVPIIIYCLSYIPFVDSNSTGFIDKVINNQQWMFEYHSTLEATHPYSSRWYQWPIMTRPVWYYTHTVSETVGEGISAFGNPLVWWLGMPATVYMVYLMLFFKDRTAIKLIIGYLAQYLPWVFVSRATFAYHYFPSVPFVVLMIAYSLLQLKEKMKTRAYVTILILYGTGAFVVFLLFYPVLAGQPIELEFVKEYLRWSSGWVLVN